MKMRLSISAFLWHSYLDILCHSSLKPMWLDEQQNWKYWRTKLQQSSSICLRERSAVFYWNRDVSINFLGTKPYQEPSLWRSDVVIVALLLLLLLFIVAILVVCACRSAHRNDKLFYKRKQFFRESLVRKSRQNGRFPGQTATAVDFFDTMNPGASSNLAAQNGW